MFAVFFEDEKVLEGIFMMTMMDMMMVMVMMMVVMDMMMVIVTMMMMMMMVVMMMVMTTTISVVTMLAMLLRLGKNRIKNYLKIIPQIPLSSEQLLSYCEFEKNEAL